MRDKIIEIAKSQIGYKEEPANSNKTKYGKWFNLDGVMWCAIFVSWVFNEARIPLPQIGFKHGYAGCQTGFAYWVKQKMITITPQPGDIVLFDWNGDKRYDHTGIFEKDNGDGFTFTAIEGNTAIGNNSNGGEVMRRTKRKYDQAVFVDITSYLK